MSTFLGIGMGPIQTGIFLSGAAQGKFDRLVVADVDKELIAAVRQSGRLTINIAGADRLSQEVIAPVEIYDSSDSADLARLVKVAAEADEIATALPGVKFFTYIASWLRDGFALAPERRRFIYTAENDNFAAEKLAAAIAQPFPHTYYLNTVIGKMSKVLDHAAATPEMAPLCPGLQRGHLVESFNRILIGEAPEIASRRTAGLYAKAQLYPFEEAKLYGHNAVHFLLGWQAAQHGLTSMHQLAAHPELLQIGRDAFLNECGPALCRKWEGQDELFTADGFRAYAEDLLVRMCNPFLQDRVDRVIRDLPRKLSPDDRVMGTIKTCLEQGVVPTHFLLLAADCLRQMQSEPA
ncbi:MAG: hypothetical protein PHQ27_05015 [Victivallales bacterium]|nr:hypothetical protein [Victivallales bacterium]